MRHGCKRRSQERAFLLIIEARDSDVFRDPDSVRMRVPDHAHRHLVIADEKAVKIRVTLKKAREKLDPALARPVALEAAGVMQLESMLPQRIFPTQSESGNGRPESDFGLYSGQ